MKLSQDHLLILSHGGYPTTRRQKDEFCETIHSSNGQVRP